MLRHERQLLAFLKNVAERSINRKFTLQQLSLCDSCLKLLIFRSIGKLLRLNPLYEYKDKQSSLIIVKTVSSDHVPLNDCFDVVLYS